MILLSHHLEKYLKLRKQLGYKLRVQSILLRHFVRFAEQEGASFITTKLALRWASPPNIKPGQRANRLGMVRRFAKYMSALDARTEIPEQKLLPYQFRRQDPYLYRDEEVSQLVKAAWRIDPIHQLKGPTYGTLFGLLAATGMRVGEALTLDREDVDLNGALITIRRSKGNKSRLIPLHASTRLALQQYASLRNKVFPRPECSRFFVSEKGTRLLYSTVNRWFLLVAGQIGLRKNGADRGARIHDLRHYFAIRTLLNWYRSNADVETRLPALATYLGHVHVRDSYWYISATPELLQLATLRMQGNEKGGK